MSYFYDLVGEEGILFGGNIIDGGIENYKIMWCIFCFVYSQWMFEGIKIFGYELLEVEIKVWDFFVEYVE